MARRGWLFADRFNDLVFLVADYPAESSGVVLVDEREASAIRAFQERLNAIYSDLGDVEYAAYRSDPRWASVRGAAVEAAAVLDPTSTATASSSRRRAVVWASVRDSPLKS